MAKKFIKWLLLRFRFIPFIKYYVFEWELAGKAFNLLIINFFFQRILRINCKVSFSIHFTSKISYPSRIELIKDKTTMNSFVLSGNCYFQAHSGIKIGKNFLFAPGIKIISSNHDFKNRDLPSKTSPVIIGDNVWMGTSAIILPGVEIGNNCIIGAGSVVTKSFKEDNLLIAGNPAKIIKLLKN
ncbi:MAG TPA: acyltransferase [Bacteroidales bacterium]|nr:acyltransferase [Bacteroidales bacterium]HRW21082.1 acyltransferase [Bacteroidales bacterium]